MLLRYFTDFYAKIDQIISDYESDYNTQKYGRLNTADPNYFDEQIQFFNDMKLYCEKNGYQDITKIMSNMKPFYTKNVIVNLIKQYSSRDKYLYLQDMKNALELVIDSLKLNHENNNNEIYSK